MKGALASFFTTAFGASPADFAAVPSVAQAALISIKQAGTAAWHAMELGGREGGVTPTIAFYVAAAALLGALSKQPRQ
eukprot:SM000297S10931  [mRNA]  locus=s297:32916:33373:- [translate_table: standard]